MMNGNPSNSPVMHLLNACMQSSVALGASMQSYAVNTWNLSYAAVMFEMRKVRGASHGS